MRRKRSAARSSPNSARSVAPTHRASQVDRPVNNHVHSRTSSNRRGSPASRNPARRKAKSRVRRRNRARRKVRSKHPPRRTARSRRPAVRLHLLRPTGREISRASSNRPERTDKARRRSTNSSRSNRPCSRHPRPACSIPPRPRILSRNSRGHQRHRREKARSICYEAATGRDFPGQVAR